MYITYTIYIYIPTNSPSFHYFYLDSILISTSKSFLNIGVYFDYDLSIYCHIANISIAANYYTYTHTYTHTHIYIYIYIYIYILIPM